MANWHIKSDHVFDRKSLNLLKKWWMDIDRINFILIISVIIFGFIMTVTSSPDVANRIGVDKLFFIEKQIIFSTLAIIFLMAISFLNQEYIKIFAILGMFIILILLTIVLLYGLEVKGAKRWMTLFGFTLQPSEFAKVFFVIFNAFLLQKLYSKKWFVKYGFSTLFFFIIASLLILQPDFGMTLTLTFLWLAQLFLFGLPILLIIFISFLGLIGAAYAYVYLPHVQDRISRFIDIDVQNYQVDRSLDAYANGGLFGVGPGSGLVKRYIPDAHTDFVFAVAAEEFGTIFCILVICVFLCIATRVIKRVFQENNLFAYLSVSGLLLLFIFQIFVNIGVSLGLLPTKGMTLPFISYGGSSVIAMSICFGVILALTKKKYVSRAEEVDVVIA